MNIKEILNDGERILSVDCGDWLAEIVLTRGANLWRLRHASTLELLRTPPSVAVFREKTEMWGMPVLLPPNRIAGGRFSCNGRSYQLPINDASGRHHIHGLLSRREWQLDKVTDEAITLHFDNHPERDCYSWFPHEFTISLTYRFEKTTVVQEIKVINHGTDPMPFGLGFHTAFRLPFGDSSGGNARNCRVKATVGSWRWEMDPVELQPTGRQLPLPADMDWNYGVITEEKDVFLHVPIITRDGFRGAIIESPDDNARLIYEVDEKFLYWVLWNYGGGHQFFCPEPQTWMINAPNQPMGAEQSGMAALMPGDSWSGVNRITLQLME